MSRSYTSRPTVSRTQGRGRGTQTQSTNGTRMQGARPKVGAPSNPGLGNQTTETAENSSNQEIGQRMSYEGGFTKITPNMQKRQQINDMAARETEAYEAHKQQHTQKSFSYVGTAGGGQMTQTEARQKLIQTSPSKAQKLLQNQARKSFVKQKEDEELQKKKDMQRQKAVQNVQRKKDTDQAQADRWDEQKRRTNEAFLNRLEAKNRKAMSGSSQTASTKQMPSESQRTLQPAFESQRRLQPEGAAVREENSENRGGNYSEDNTCDDGDDDLTSEQRRSLVALASVCPQYPKDTLIDILQQVDFSIDSAIMLLTE